MVITVIIYVTIKKPDQHSIASLITYKERIRPILDFLFDSIPMQLQYQSWRSHSRKLFLLTTKECSWSFFEPSLVYIYLIEKIYYTNNINLTHIFRLAIRASQEKVNLHTDKTQQQVTGGEDDDVKEEMKIKKCILVFFPVIQFTWLFLGFF